jgi:L-seryl-tRNA(Ser) seleniumtransferase
MSDPRQSLPGVDSLLDSPPFASLLDTHPRTRVVRAIRRVLTDLREALAADPTTTVPNDPEGFAALARVLLARWQTPSLRGVINATGVVLHTNLGRAPLAEAARDAMARVGKGYSNLEFDVQAGVRGSRYDHCVSLLQELTGAESALVVNNNAAAVVLSVNTFARGKRVLVSRGELVEIGGGFRIPDMLSGSGAILREVGTTNKTRVEDYRTAVEEGGVAAILKVHRSNFRMTGFTQEASLEELVALARTLGSESRGLRILHDLGSGMFAEPSLLGLPSEPLAVDSLASGVDVVAVSGDKLLGGPQAGILLGKDEFIGEMRRNPLCRAFRVDKVTLAALEATLRLYLDPDKALREIPALRALAASPQELEGRARALARRIVEAGAEATAVEGTGMVGGGTFPGVELPGWCVRIQGSTYSAEALAHRLRGGDPPVVCRRDDDAILLDVRTVDPREEEDLLRRVSESLQLHAPGHGS